MSGTVRIVGDGDYENGAQGIATLVTAALTFCAQPETFPVFAEFAKRSAPDFEPFDLLTIEITAETARALINGMRK